MAQRAGWPAAKGNDPALLLAPQAAGRINPEASVTRTLALTPTLYGSRGRTGHAYSWSRRPRWQVGSRGRSGRSQFSGGRGGRSCTRRRTSRPEIPGYVVPILTTPTQDSFLARLMRSPEEESEVRAWRLADFP